MITRLDPAAKMLHTPNNHIHLAHTGTAPTGETVAILRYQPNGPGDPRFTVHIRSVRIWHHVGDLPLATFADAKTLLAKAHEAVSVSAYPTRWQPLIELLNLARTDEPAESAA